MLLRKRVIENSPHDNLAKDIRLLPDLFKDFLPVSIIANAGALDLVLTSDDGKGASRGLVVVNVRASGLKDATNKDNLEEGIRVLEKFERGTGGYEFGRDGVILGRRDGEKMGKKGVSED